VQNKETVNSPPALLPFPGPVKTARLIGRRVRFLMDLEDASGRFVAHTNNTGSMLGLLRPGSEVLLSVSDAPGRKHPCTVEAVKLWDFWVGVNTAVPTKVLKAAWEAGAMPELEGYDSFKTEPRFEGGRLDAYLCGPRGELYVETKNVTMVEDCAAQFPDAASERACKHVRELMRLKKSGIRAAFFFAVQRPDGKCFQPAEVIDPEYSRLFYEALKVGVEAWPYVVGVSPVGYSLEERLPVGS